MKEKLNTLEYKIRDSFEVNPDLINLKNINDLVRYIWDYYDMDISCESIARVARTIRADGLDTEENQEIRANAETAYHEHYNK